MGIPNFLHRKTAVLRRISRISVAHDFFNVTGKCNVWQQQQQQQQQYYYYTTTNYYDNDIMFFRTIYRHVGQVFLTRALQIRKSHDC